MSLVKSIMSCLLLVPTVWCSERVRYDFYKSYSVIPQNAEQVQILDDLRASSDSILFLSHHSVPQMSSYLTVAPHKIADFNELMERENIPIDLINENIQRAIDDEEYQMKRRSGLGFDWTTYHTLDEINKWMDSLVVEYSQVQPISVGKSYEGREIKGVKVSYKSGNPGIFIEGGIHAREWITPATVTYILNELLISTDPRVRNIAENYDWYIVPSFNPDGYVYTHTTNRLWRKTRKPYGTCVGVDPNRNWNVSWNTHGTSNKPCSEVFSGNKPFSEVETRTISNYISSLNGKISTYLAFHSYSQLLLFPYGHTRAHIENHDDLQKIGETAATALSRRYGTQYKVGNIYDAIYPASGGSMDWVFSALDNVKVVYTYELRPGSNNYRTGFVLPADQIIPTAEETLDSVVVIIEEAKKLGY